MPIAYVIREEEERLPSETTDNDIDLATRGRLDGEFWVADNRAVWEFLHDKSSVKNWNIAHDQCASEV